MKRIIRIFAVALSVALLVCGFAFAGTVSSSAADATYTSGFTYTPQGSETEVYEAADFGAVLEGAKSGSTITMHGDTVYDVNTGYTVDANNAKSGNPIATLNAYDANKGGPLTVDLGGHTLTVIQHFKGQNISIQSQNKLTIKNGTIKVLWADENNQTVRKSFPLFHLSWGNAQLSLENVNTYTTTLVYAPSAAADVKVNIDGGVHYSAYQSSDIIGGFVETRTPMTFIAKNATFYIGEKSALLSSLSYSAVKYNVANPANAMELATSFQFTNCDIITEDITTNLIKYANEYTTIKFLDSRISGSLGAKYSENGKTVISVPLHSNDSENGIAKAKEGSIILGASTVYATEATVGTSTLSAIMANGVDVGSYVNSTAIVVSADPTYTTNVTEEKTYSLELPPESFDLVFVQGEDGEYSVSSYNYDTTASSVTYSYQVREKVPVFEYITASGESTIYYYGETTLGNLVTNAESGATVKLNYDYDLSTHGDEYIGYIDKGITIDLNGHTFTVNQIRTSDAVNGQSKFAIRTAEAIIVKNGVIGVKHTDQAASYPLFLSESGKAVNLTFDNVTSYTGGLVFLYNGNGSTITFEGGEHHVLYKASGSVGGLVGSLCSADVTFNGSTIYTEGSGRLLGAASLSSAASDPYADFTFNNCNILAQSASALLINVANEFTRINFNACNIYGSINAASNTFYDKNAAAFGGVIANPQPHTILLDSDCYYSSEATLMEDVVSPTVGRFVDGSKSITLDISFLEKDPSFYGFNGVAQSKTYTFDKAISGDHFEITDSSGTVQYFTGSLAGVLNQANAGSTIRFLGNVTADGSTGDYDLTADGNLACIINIKKAITFDLDGRTLNIIQGGHVISTNNKIGQEPIRIQTNDSVVFKNGVINARNVSSKNSYYIFQGETSAMNVTFENLETYSGALYYSYGGAGNVTMNNCEHHVPYQCSGSWTSSWMEVHAGINFVANNTRFYTDGTNSLFAAVSNKNTGAFNFEFNNCDVVSKTGSANLIRYANNLTSFEFNNCNIVGNITPAVHSYDTNNDKTVIGEGGVVFGLGTVYKGTYTDGLVAVAEGAVLEEKETTKTLTGYHLVSTDVWTNGFNVSKTVASYTFTIAVTEGVIVEVMNPSTGSFETSTLKPGAAITVPTVDTSVTDASSNWYVMGYTGGWVDANGNPMSELVATSGTMQLYPEVSLTPKLKAAKYNLILMGHVQLQFFLPTTLPEGVTLTSVKKGTSTLSGTTVTMDGASYKQYSTGAIGVSALANDVVVVVTFDVTVDGNQTKTLTQTITMSPMLYAEQVLKDSSGAYEEVKPVCANLVRYTQAVLAYAGTSNSTVDTLYTDYAKNYCTPTNLAYLEKQTGATANTALEGYIEYVTFGIESYQPKFRIKLAQGAKVTKVDFYIVGGYKSSSEGNSGTGVGEINWFYNIKQTVNSNWGLSYWTESGKLSYRGSYYDDMWTKSSGTVDTETDPITSYICVTCPDNVASYNINKQIKFSLTLEDGTLVEGTYDLPTYYQGIKAQYDAGTVSKDVYDKTTNVLLAIDAYADSVAAYRFGPAIDENGYVHYSK